MLHVSLSLCALPLIYISVYMLGRLLIRGHVFLEERKKASASTDESPITGADSLKVRRVNTIWD